MRDVEIVETAFRSLDGLTLRGTLVSPAASTGPATVLVHGGGVTREEGGFFTRLAGGLAEAGLASLRFDFRAHGESEGRQEEMTLAGVANDIRSAIGHMQVITGGSGPVNVVAASFSGGVACLVAARYPEVIRRLVLINPLLNHYRRFVDDKPYWHDGHLDDRAAEELAAHGFLLHGGGIRLGRAMLNEVHFLQAHRVLGEVTAPVLIIHGTGDTFIPVESSRDAVGRFGGRAELVEVEGMQHGVAMPDDPQYLRPQTRRWQADAIARMSSWLSAEDLVP